MWTDHPLLPPPVLHNSLPPSQHSPLPPPLILICKVGLARLVYQHQTVYFSLTVFSMLFWISCCESYFTYVYYTIVFSLIARAGGTLFPDCLSASKVKVTITSLKTLFNYYTRLHRSRMTFFLYKWLILYNYFIRPWKNTGIAWNHLRLWGRLSDIAMKVIR